jgi:hypothetical protein
MLKISDKMIFKVKYLIFVLLTIHITLCYSTNERKIFSKFGHLFPFFFRGSIIWYRCMKTNQNNQFPEGYL